MATGQEARRVYYVSELTSEDNKLHKECFQFQELLSLIGINTMTEAVELAIQLHRSLNPKAIKEPGGDIDFAPQVEIEVDTTDKEALWDFHRQLQACAVMSFGLWQNDSFEVYTGTLVDFNGLFGAQIVDKYAVFQRGNESKETYMKLYFTYITKARQVREAFLGN